MAVGHSIDFSERRMIELFIGKLPDNLSARCKRSFLDGTPFKDVVKYFKSLQQTDVEVEIIKAEEQARVAVLDKMKQHLGANKNGKPKGDAKNPNKNGKQFNSPQNKPPAQRQGGAQQQDNASKPKLGFKLSPCRNCGGMGHLSQNCTNLTGSKAAEGTQCYACKGTGHFASECANNKEASNTTVPTKTQTGSNNKSKQLKDKVSETSKQGNEQA